MNNNYVPGNPQGGNRQKKEIFNQWQAIGVLRSFKENEPLKFTPWKNGGVLNALLSVVEPIGQDENGNPKTRKFSIKVSIKTNKNITAQQLQSLATGTKVRIVSRLVIETFTDRENKQNTRVCADVYVIEVLEMPMQSFAQPPTPNQYYPGYQQQYPQQQQQYAQHPQTPQYQQYPQYPGQTPVPPQYLTPPQTPSPQGQYPPYPPQPGQQPPWYQVHEQCIDDLPPAH